MGVRPRPVFVPRNAALAPSSTTSSTPASAASASARETVRSEQPACSAIAARETPWTRPCSQSIATTSRVRIARVP
ncbi:hypothetical protein AFB00_29880 (plasmid) [Pseudonocardia sp. HH130630-07]|nr:hypothetical protein AFB00_29880 [Pseudonocardia sp. HH130630-07]